MAVKTITVTESAYHTLASLKHKKESFSDVILRIGKRRPLHEFFGLLEEEKGKQLGEAIRKARLSRNIAHKKRLRAIVEQLGGRP